MVNASTKSKPSSKTQQQGNTQIDFCKIGRLCRYFQQVQNQAALEPCIGFLEKTKSFKHFVYQNPLPTQVADDSKSLSLKQILHSAAEEKREEDWIEKLLLARLLALAVLRFHGTKWLPESWGSSDVRFLCNDANRKKLPDSPCFNARLANPSTQTPQIEHPNLAASSLAINERLFNFGIVLIELGYNAPFETLSQIGGLQVGPSSQVANFIAARRLGESAHQKLNMTYGVLVEKCLNCNFDSKLNTPELQGAVVAQVVNQLDICLGQYRTFNSLIPVPVAS
jgi:hypothetical protein